MYIDSGSAGLPFQLIVLLVVAGGAIVFAFRKKIRSLFTMNKDKIGKTTYDNAEKPVNNHIIRGGYMNERICPRCGVPNDEDAKFCESCGAGILQQEPKQMSCESCGAAIDGNSNFCKNCGAAIQSVVGAPIVYPQQYADAPVSYQQPYTDATNAYQQSYTDTSAGYEAYGEMGSIECNEIPTTLPVISPFLGYIPSFIAHKKVEDGTTVLENAVFGKPQGHQNTLVGVLMLFVPQIIMIIAIASGNDLPPALVAICCFAITASIFWLWLSSCKQRDRLLRLANELGIPVVDNRGFGLSTVGCFGSTLFLIVVFVFAFYLVFLLGPLVRQYRTIKMYNDVVESYKRRYMGQQ